MKTLKTPKTSHWLGIIAIIILISCVWNFNHSDSLGLALWTAYESVAVVLLTLARVGALGFAVIWIMEKVERGVVEERLDIQRASVGRQWVEKAANRS